MRAEQDSLWLGISRLLPRFARKTSLLHIAIKLTSTVFFCNQVQFTRGSQLPI